MSANLRGSVATYYLAKAMLKMKEFGTRGVARIPNAPMGSTIANENGWFIGVFPKYNVEQNFH